MAFPCTQRSDEEVEVQRAAASGQRAGDRGADDDECYTLAPLHVAGTKKWCQVRFNGEHWQAM